MEFIKLNDLRKLFKEKWDFVKNDSWLPDVLRSKDYNLSDMIFIPKRHPLSGNMYLAVSSDSKSLILHIIDETKKGDKLNICYRICKFESRNKLENVLYSPKAITMKGCLLAGDETLYGIFSYSIPDNFKRYESDPENNLNKLARIN